MPFRDYTDFGFDTLQAMTQAYDAAVGKLALENTNPLTSELAALIVSMVRSGELDSAQLCDRAVEWAKKRIKIGGKRGDKKNAPAQR
jgi:hypothetical protein